MPLAAPVPLTDLEAVNAMLHDIGDRPVNDIENPSRLDVVRAVKSLTDVNRATQQRGWWFNTEKLAISVDSNGHYNVPDYTSRIEVYSGGPRYSTASEDNGCPELVLRGTKLYDRVNGTDVFVGAEPVKLTIVKLLPYTELPSTAREYIYAVASIRFQSRTLGSSSVDQDLRNQAASAWAVLLEEDIDFENTDQTWSPHFVNLMHNR